MSYIVKVHPDAREPAEEKYEFDEGSEAMNRAIAEAEAMQKEPAGIDIGEAGDDELFEVFPSLGLGTVVVSEV